VPTVLRRNGYAIRIYPNDHPPAHVHVKRDGHEARVTLVEVEVVTNYGFNPRELRELLEIIGEAREELLAVWDSYHPSR